MTPAPNVKSEGWRIAKPFGSMPRIIYDIQDTIGVSSTGSRREGARMATKQDILLSTRSALARRTALKNIVRLIPAVVIIAATLNTLSCGSSGLLTYATSSSSTSPTATPTSTAGTLAFVTNYNDGKVSSFTRNITTGALKHTGQVTAGVKKGPRGVVASPNGSFLYVANIADDNIYEYSIASTKGIPTALPTPSISNGAGSGPDQIAVNPAGTFLFVTGFANGTITTYAIDATTGQLTQQSKVIGLVNPFGIAADSTGSFVYVADNGAELIYSFGINGSGALSQIGLPVFDLGSPGGTPGFIAIDPAGTFIYVTDLNAGVVAVLGVSGGVLSFGSLVPSTTTGNKPVGIGYAAASSANFIFTANQGTATMWSFQIPSPGFPSSPVQFGTGDLSAPTGLVVDPQNLFLYATNQNAGTVSQFSLSPACIGAGAPCFVASVSTESPHNASSGPFGITLAQ
ncbi:MAG TPA: beta-propeller fold lactonase family protein [Stellaceae bacterium]|nr:beta-propeller fold lactonase family protein [Stellaceae bacterium]